MFDDLEPSDIDEPFLQEEDVFAEGPWELPPDEPPTEDVVPVPSPAASPSRNRASASSSSSLAPTLPMTSSGSPATPVARSSGQDTVVGAAVITPEKRRRLTGKTHPSLAGPALVPDDDSYLGHVCLDVYLKLNSEQRRNVAKRMGLVKYRLTTKLKAGTAVTLGDEVVQVTDDVELAFATSRFEHLFYRWVAKDEKRADTERGWAMDYLARTSKTAQSGCFEVNRDDRKYLKTKSLLLTYQGNWGVLDFKPPEGVSVDDLAVLLQERPEVQSLQKDAEELLKNLQEHRCISHWAFSVELCVKTWLATGEVRVHIHVWTSPTNGLIKYSLLKFRSSLPYVNYTAMAFFAGGRCRSEQGWFAGAFYVSISKIGSVATKATIEPWTGYPVKDQWVTSLYQAEKISVQVAEQAYYRCVVRAEQNVKQLQFAEAGRQRLRLEQLREANARMVQTSLRTWKVLPEVTAWQQQFREHGCRFRFLVLHGRSRTGKTMFAMGLVGVGRSLHCDCTSGIPDMREFSYERHQLVVLDEISPAACISLKRLLQATNELCVLGVSPTLQHAYRVYCYRTMFVVCTNCWESGMKELGKDDQEWLTANSIAILVDEPLWNESS